MLAWVMLSLVAIAAAIAAWGWFEAGWLRRRVLEVELQGLPPELDGLRIAHLSDFHLGVPSRGTRAAEQAVDWVATRRPELMCVTGDLVSRRAGLPRLERLLAKLSPCFVILGNHDFASSRDPFSQRIGEDEISALEGVTMLGDDATEVVLRGQRVQIAGVDPRSYAAGTADPAELVDTTAGLRILLCHFPGIARRLTPGIYHLILAGHMHAGQIAIPFPGGKLRLAHLHARDVEGPYRYGETVLHVSPGIGTTFVPFRFFARPEVTELVLRKTGIRSRGFRSCEDP